MTDSANRQGMNTGLLVVLILAGLFLIFVGMRGGMHLLGINGFWPWDHSYRFGLFGPLYGFMGIWGLISIALAIWVGVDANRKGQSALLWGGLTFFTGIVGLIVYLIVSPALAARNGTARSSLSTAAPPVAPPASHVTCGSCQAQVQADFKVCPYCGSALQDRCPQCGKPREAAWKVCPYCAAPLAGDAAE